MEKISHFLKISIRFLVVWFVDTVSILITASLIPGISLFYVGETPEFVIATAAAFLLGIINLLIRPLLLLITLPLGWMVIFAAGFFINAITLMITAVLLPGFDVSNWWAAFFGGLFLAFINTILTTLLALDDDESFYQNLIERRAARYSGEIEASDTRGLVMLETDGLSYQRIQKAVADGHMPTVKKMIEEEGYQITLVDCGMPPTTPACQAGIMHGNNTSIPAFRWLDKTTGKMLAGGGAAALVEPVLSDGNGLLRGGSSIGNMFSGDAAKSILTFSKIKAGTPEDKKQRARDMYFLMRSPYFFVRVLVLYFADVALEIFQGWQQRRQNVQPRLNRLHNGYPFLRAAVNVFLRDIGTYFTILDIVRGVPAIYTLYAGYDEIAHHAGPYTHDADLSLRQFDRQLERIRKAITEKAKRPYEIIILSDHGQSYGATFKQRYGMSILEFVQQQMPQGINVSGSGGGDNGSIGVSAMLDELENMEEQKESGRIGKTAIHQGKRLIKTNLSQQDSFQEVETAKVTLAYGGNGAHVYFDLYPRKITFNELNEAYPGMIDGIVGHEGIGFVVAYDDDFDPVVLGKNGARNLVTGDVTGEDPLIPFGDVDLRAWQLRRMAEFENSGDLILNSTIYPDGSVAALEEMIGSHGGMGGEQTDAYIFHPGDMEVPATRNSYEVKAILDSRRGLPGPTPLPEQPVEPEVNPGFLPMLVKGLIQVKKWLGYAAQSIILNRETFAAIGDNAFMTGPAILIALLSVILQTLHSHESFDVTIPLIRFGGWILSVVFMAMAAKILRGKADFPKTFRVMGFAQSAHVLDLIGFLPIIGEIARFIAVIVTLFATWIGVATVQDIKGWRSLFLPVVYLVIITVSSVFLISAIEGTAFSLDAIMMDLGLSTGN